MPLKYHPKLGLLPGFKRDPSAERAKAEERLAHREKVRTVKAKKALLAQGFVMDKFMGHIRNLTGRK